MQSTFGWRSGSLPALNEAIQNLITVSESLTEEKLQDIEAELEGVINEVEGRVIDLEAEKLTSGSRVGKLDVWMADYLPLMHWSRSGIILLGMVTIEP